MKGIRPAQLALVAVGVLAGLVVASGRGRNAADDSYAPLRVYDGKWDIAPSDGAARLRDECGAPSSPGLSVRLRRQRARGRRHATCAATGVPVSR
jgi:hypothetical protein